MSILLSVPSEIHLAIFGALDDALDIMSLSSACRSLRSLLVSNTRTLLRRAASQRFWQFDDCLRAARASKLPIEWEGNHFDLQENRYPTPPTKVFCESLASAPPTFDELLTVKQISRTLVGWLTRFGEIMRIEGFTEHAEESFYRAGARYLLMSYLFSGAFLEPLRDRKQPDHTTDEDGVKRFPPYHTADPDWRYSQLENLYGGFIDWIVEEGEKQEPLRSWTAAPDGNPNFNPFRKILRSLFGIGPELKARKSYGGLVAVSSLLLMLELSEFLAVEMACVEMEGVAPGCNSLRLCHFGEFRPKFEYHSDHTGRNILMGFLIGPGHSAESSPIPTHILRDVFRPPSNSNDADDVYRPYMDFFRIAFKDHKIAFYHERHEHYIGLSTFFLYDRAGEA